MAIKKVKISELPLEETLKGLHTIGVNSKNESVKVSLEFVETAANRANEAADNADTKREEIEANEAERQSAEEARAAAEKTREAQETAREKASQTAVQNAEAATGKANKAAEDATAAKEATEEATQAARDATTAATKAKDEADKATAKATIAASEADRARTEIEANEQARKEAETARAEAEKLRQSQEEARQTASDKAVKDANTATQAATEATTKANAATEAAEQATTEATAAATKANNAADRVTDSITDIIAEKEAALKAAAKATEAATQADTSRQQIETNEEARNTAEQSRATAEQERKAAEAAREKASAAAVKKAETATTNANKATTAATQAAEEAQTAAQEANAAAQKATTAAGEASAAATNATKAKSDAEAATKKATDAAASATSAAAQATTAAGQADTATAGANTAKENAEAKIAEMNAFKTDVEAEIEDITGQVEAETTRAKAREDEIEAAYEAADTKITTDYKAADAKTLADAKQHAETKIAELVGSAPEALNTLEEIAAKLKEDEGATEAMLQQIGEKADTTYVNDELAKKVNKSGDTMTGPLVINPGSAADFNEGIRISLSNAKWSTIAFGSEGASGVPTNGWIASRNPMNKFIISPASCEDTTGLTLNKDGDALWRNNKLWHDGNFDPNSKADATHKHTHTDISDWNTELAKKADASHTHDTYATKTEVNAKANDADVVKNTMVVKATKLEAGQEPTIDYDKASNTLTVGIPKGDTGATGAAGPAGANGKDGATGPAGPAGPAGAAAGFGAPTATVDSGIGTPGVTVTATGPDTAKEFNFAFTNLKGEKGEPGTNGVPGEPGAPGTPGAAAGFGTPTATATALEAGAAPTVTITPSGDNTSKVFAFEFGIPKGDKGDPGVNATTTEVATTSKNGLMSATDKQKLDNLKEFSGYVTAGQKANTVLGENATAEGNNTTASGYCSHAEGNNTTASGYCSHAEGNKTTASGYYSHAEGSGTIASGEESHAEGSGTIASGYYQHVGGKYNVEKDGMTGTNTESAFIIGNGTSSSRSNALRVQFDGAIYSQGSFHTSGADYAEYFEWADGNPDKEDRRGLFVTLDGDKIRTATDKDDYILGIVSPNPSVVGNSPDEWHGRFLKDEWGNRITETITERVKKPTPGKPEEEWETEERQVESYVVNPEFSEEHGEYVPRSERAEWAAVGMLGVLVTRDDGTCRPNGYCKVDSNGRATASDIGYRVLKRVNGNLVKVLFR